MFTIQDLKNLLQVPEAFQTIQNEAADQNSPNHLESKLKLGICQAYGLQTPQNLIQGFEKMFAVLFFGKKGSLEAEHILLEIIKSKHFSDTDLEPVFNYYKAADNNSPQIQTILAFCYRYEFGVSENKAECYSLSTKAAANAITYAPGLVALGDCFEYGIGVTKDPKKARTLYDQANKQNYAPASYRLGFPFVDDAIPTVTPQANSYAAAAPSLATLSGTSEAQTPRRAPKIIPLNQKDHRKTGALNL